MQTISGGFLQVVHIKQVTAFNFGWYLPLLAKGEKGPMQPTFATLLGPFRQLAHFREFANDSGVVGEGSTGGGSCEKTWARPRFDPSPVEDSEVWVSWWRV